MTYQPSFTAYLNSFSASRCNHNGYHQSAYVMANLIHARHSDIMVVSG